VIAYIKGTVEQLSGQSVTLDNQGIGYIINASPATLSRLPKKGEPTQLYTHMQVKEDGISLFGFLTPEELQMYNLLISVSGVGPKVGMSILAALTPAQIVTAIANGDAIAFSKAPGVGKKTAQRISLELQDKIKSKDSAGNFASDTATTMAVGTSSEKQDAIDALLALGYSYNESLRVVLEVAVEGMTVEQIIKGALKKMAQ